MGEAAAPTPVETTRQSNDQAVQEALPARTVERVPVVPPEPPSPSSNPEEHTGTADRPAPATARSSWLAAIRRRFVRPNGAHQIPAEAAGGAIAPSEASVAPAASNVRDFNPVLPEVAGPAKSSDEIFVEIGQQLRARREMLSLTYEEIERHTHVRTVFLQALEQGAMQDLPSPVQTRGVLVNYAGFLDLDVDSILLRFADGVQARHREKGPQKPTRSRAPLIVRNTLPPLRSFIASDLVFGGGLAILLLLFAVWGINRVIAVRSEAASQVTPPSISDILASTAVPTLVQQVTVIPAQDTPSPAAADASPTLELATLSPNVRVQVLLSASESTYMRVTVDGKVKFEGRADVGSTYSYQASEQVEILVGNAAALRVTYNGRDLGLMGSFGEVVDRLYTVEGVATPTFTPAPTRTPTPKVTRTPTQTLTLTPSPTRTP